MRVFLAHPQSAADSELVEWTEAIESLLKESDLTAEVVTGRDDFGTWIAIDGTVDAWASGICTRKDSFTGERWFSMVFVPSVEIGKATALIIESALKVATPVFVLKGGQAFHVVRVEVLNADDYANGWRLIVE